MLSDDSFCQMKLSDHEILRTALRMEPRFEDAHGSFGSKRGAGPAPVTGLADGSDGSSGRSETLCDDPSTASAGLSDETDDDVDQP